MLYSLRVDVAPQEQGSARVPEIVPADRGEARSLEERLEVAIDYVLGVQRGALARAENEVRVFVQACPNLLPPAGACDGS